MKTPTTPKSIARIMDCCVVVGVFILRKLFGMGTPRGLQRGLDSVFGQLLAAHATSIAIHWHIQIHSDSRRLDDDGLAFATVAA